MIDIENLIIPNNAILIMDLLESNGHSVYLVGGCVRDSILGETPNDWDLSTSATPEEMIEILQDSFILEQEPVYGTVTATMDGESYELTTFRADGEYTDGRHPKEVTFVKTIELDCLRRDFTINAMAYNPKSGISTGVPHFDGYSDLDKNLIRAVGNANERFQEDNLRILRALRFASTLGFKIEKETHAAIFRNRNLLVNVSEKRIMRELKKLLMGKNVKNVLINYAKVFAVIIPEIEPMIKFNQRNPHHFLTVWEHTVEAIANSPKDINIRLAMLFHDIGKPQCYTQDEHGIGHFMGHPDVSTELTTQILKKLKNDKSTINEVCQLVRFHDYNLSTSVKSVKRCLNKFGLNTFEKLLLVKEADLSAQNNIGQFSDFDSIRETIKTIIAQNECFSLKDLSINGHDILSLNVTCKKTTGKVLHTILNEVMDNSITNEKAALIDRAVQLIKTIECNNCEA